MLSIGLDLAQKTVGIAIIDTITNDLKYHSIELTNKEYKTKSAIELQKVMVDLIIDVILSIIKNTNHELVIEDVFTGVNPKASINAARVQGALIDRYMLITSKLPKLIMAVTARKNIGIDVRWHKAQIQMYIIDKFKLGKLEEKTKGDIISLPIQYDRKIDILKMQLKTAGIGRKKLLKEQMKELKKEYNNTMSRLSTEIKKQTLINEHIADAIVLAMQMKELSNG